MTSFVVFFEDNDEFADQRPKFMADHLAFLKANAHAISAAGPLHDPKPDASAGGLWLVRADSVDDVETLIRDDPFWTTGLRKSHRILEWRRVFRDGSQVISQ